MVKILRKIIVVLILLTISYCYATNRIYDSSNKEMVNK
ncbi:Uncharacterised protein [Streptobacillus moniliformis]|uniref:Uncharacterized protein n=1 Tax=Streptobacillus moniliformis (strain ATCC 14647 / DSM 12112 / NCTC 10651 / 9901) TaxID=519441 RepID=D1AX92_STRM9|nr:hypothetical protein Smon_0437 [Streptobacillus moniliformis DSM 12112]SQA13943.1 Uncharacterised protein [Streptobacillus moniliformis]